MDPLELAASIYLRSQDNKSAYLSDPQIEDLFHQTRPSVEEALADTEYFHGTGKVHYEHFGASKYEGTNPDMPVDTLPSFLKNGLNPKPDLFAQDFVGTADPSISLSQRRMYSRVYSDCFMPEGEKLDYEYGSRQFWWLYFLAKMFLDGATDPEEYKLHIKRKKINGICYFKNFT